MTLFIFNVSPLMLSNYDLGDKEINCKAYNVTQNEK